MRRAEDFVDVTLATSGGLQGDAVGNRYKAHRYQDLVLLNPKISNKICNIIMRGG